MDYLKYIKKFESDIEKELKSNYEIIFDKDLKKVKEFSSITWVVVGDNPGKTELKNKRYFSEGTAAKGLKKCFDEKLKLKRNENYICLNKTPIYSVKTDDLSAVDQNLLQKSFSITAELIFNLHILNPKINVLIVGFSSKSIKSFFSELKKQYEKNENLINNIYVVPHFSYNWFARRIDINKIIDEKSFITQLKKEQLYRMLN
ncbi:MAG: hypothetical protein ACRC5W_04355 [Cetobacterium sp.]